MSELSPTERLRKAWRARQVTWLASGLIVCVLVWAVFAQLDQVVVAQGQMIPTRTVQKIQSLEGGIGGSGPAPAGTGRHPLSGQC